MQTHHIPVMRSARYYTLGELNAKTSHVYIALHGYGQLASSIIHKFDDLIDGQVFVIAPEGLSRFYWDGMTGQVGASWMTKEDRNLEIEEYCDFLQSIYAHFFPKIPTHAQIHLLGFSQGGATAMRWLLLRNPSKIDNMILWASDAPPELDYKTASQVRFSESGTRLYWIYGNTDEFLPQSRIEQLEKGFAQFQLYPKTIVFQGAHELHRPTLLDLHNEFSAIS